MGPIALEHDGAFLTPTRRADIYRHRIRTMTRIAQVMAFGLLDVSHRAVEIHLDAAECDKRSRTCIGMFDSHPPRQGTSAIDSRRTAQSYGLFSYYSSSIFGHDKWTFLTRRCVRFSEFNCNRNQVAGAGST